MVLKDIYLCDCIIIRSSQALLPFSMSKYFRNVRKDHSVDTHNLVMNHQMIPTVMIMITPFLHRKEMMMTTIIFPHHVRLHLPKGIRHLEDLGVSGKYL